MPTALRNDDAEALILDIRIGRTAGEQDPAAGPGAFLIFPTTVVVPGSASGHLVFPLLCGIEPGTIVTGPGSAVVNGTVAGVALAGGFSWTVGDDPPAGASYRFRRRGREVAAPGWAAQLPASQHLRADAKAVLARHRSRLLRRSGAAEHWLLKLTEQVARHYCQGPIRRALRYRPPTDDDDLVQRSLQVASRLLPLYASKDRPPCSWLGMLRLDGRRDMYREVTRLDWLPAEAVAALALADACGIDLHRDPAASWPEVREAAERLGHPVPRIGLAQLEDALRAPGLVDQQIEAAAFVGEADGRYVEPGRVAAAVAQLVTTDSELIALARAGDPAAIKRVGEKVLRRLTAARQSTRLIKDRAWEEFQQSGQLFATPAGRQRFGTVADLSTLAAIDESLLRAAGIRAVAPHR